MVQKSVSILIAAAAIQAAQALPLSVREPASSNVAAYPVAQFVRLPRDEFDELVARGYLKDMHKVAEKLKPHRSHKYSQHDDVPDTFFITNTRRDLDGEFDDLLAREPGFKAILHQIGRKLKPHSSSKHDGSANDAAANVANSFFLQHGMRRDFDEELNGIYARHVEDEEELFIREEEDYKELFSREQIVKAPQSSNKQQKQESVQPTSHKAVALSLASDVLSSDTVTGNKTKHNLEVRKDKEGDKGGSSPSSGIGKEGARMAAESLRLRQIIDELD